MLPQIPLPGPHEDPELYLRHYGFEPPPLGPHRGETLLGAFVVLAIVLGSAGHGNFNGVDLTGTDVAMAVLALGALVLGYQQWREAREENSMEKYYERLDMANRRRECDPESVYKAMRNSIPALANENSSVLMYVYVELDNLEYVATKYRLGYMRASQAYRGLRTFERRCLSPTFKRIAEIRVKGGDYHDYTINIVRRVCEEIDKERDKIAQAGKRKQMPGASSGQVPASPTAVPALA